MFSFLQQNKNAYQHLGGVFEEENILICQECIHKWSNKEQCDSLIGARLI